MNRREVLIILLVIGVIIVGEAFLWFRSMREEPIRVPGEPVVDSVLMESR